MGHACISDPHPRPEDAREHPIVAFLAVVAILLAILVIAWARIAVHGTADLEATLAEPRAEHAPVPPPEQSHTAEERQVHEAVTSSRFATGFSP
jgi:hypothetical protein